MTGGGQHADLRDVIELVESGIEALSFVDDGTDAVAYELLDRLDQWPHLGVVVSSPSSEDTDRLDGVTNVWVQDEIVVELRVSTARAPGQREMRNRAFDHEQRIRAAVSGSERLQLYRPTWLRTARSASDDRAWLHLLLSFRFERFERVRWVG